jgi:hypothetical protein
MSKLRDRRLYLVLPHTQRAVLIPRPTPATIRGVPLVTAFRAHIDDLHVLAQEQPALMQGILDATKLVAQQCRQRRVQSGSRR